MSTPDPTPAAVSRAPIPKVTIATLTTLLASAGLGGLNAADHS